MCTNVATNSTGGGGDDGEDDDSDDGGSSTVIIVALVVSIVGLCTGSGGILGLVIAIVKLRRWYLKHKGNW